MNVFVAGAPGLLEIFRRVLFVEGCDLIAQPVERGTERSAPLLVPVAMAARITAAVVAPASDAVDAAPGGSFHTLDVVGGRKMFQVLGVVGELGPAFAFDVLQREGQRHVSVGVMVAVGFAVGGDVGE